MPTATRFVPALPSRGASPGSRAPARVAKDKWMGKAAAAAPSGAAARSAPGHRGRPPRGDGWTPDRRCAFLEALAEGHTVEAACGFVGLSVASAYALRGRAGGEAFALGWRAACLRARDRLSDLLYSRAIDGQTDTMTRADGETVTRHRHDNRLAMAMLTRLDRMAEHPDLDRGHACDRSDPVFSARAVAASFAGFLPLVEAGADPQAVADYVEASELHRRLQLPQFNEAEGWPFQEVGEGEEVGEPDDPGDAIEDGFETDDDADDTDDADDDGEADEAPVADASAKGAAIADGADAEPIGAVGQRGQVPSTGQAEAPGEPDAASFLPRLAEADPALPDPAPPAPAAAVDPRWIVADADAALTPIWFDPYRQGWVTSLPFAPDFDGDTGGTPGYGGFWRTLSASEQAVIDEEGIDAAIATIVAMRTHDG